MIEFGKTLREAREAKGYSVSQLAETTHILPQIIDNLEREDFSRIVAPIYGRGFVKLYCEAVGLEAKPLTDEFMEIYSGNRPPVIRMKEVEPSPSEPEPTPPEKEVPEFPAPVESAPTPAAPPAPEPATFAFDQPAIDEPPAESVRPLSHPISASKPFTPSPGDLPFPDEKAAPRRDYRLPGYSMPEVPRSVWRFGILAVAALGILALIVFGCRAIYRATMNVPASENGGKSQIGEVKPQESDAKSPSTKPRAPRKGVEIPPLYID